MSETEPSAAEPGQGLPNPHRANEEAPPEAMHPEIDEAERSGRGDPYSGLRDGDYTYEEMYDPNRPTKPEQPDA